jgi:hypothetical protein
LAPINFPLFQGGRREGLPIAVASLSFMVSLHGWKPDQDAATVIDPVDPLAAFWPHLSWDG